MDEMTTRNSFLSGETGRGEALRRHRLKCETTVELDSPHQNDRSDSFLQVEGEVQMLILRFTFKMKLINLGPRISVLVLMGSVA